MSIGKKSGIHSTAIVEREENVKIGDYIVIKPYVYINSEGGDIKIGDHCSINAFSYLGAGESNIVIGDGVRIGQGVRISCANHGIKKDKLIFKQKLEKDKDIIIENDVWVGMGACILPGVKIAKGTVVGAGAVVTKNTEKYSVVAGVPAKIIKYRK